ncbi:hypothetical protein Btru_019365 [Bulinus truncatus]|nr:hypothetical protein Btru_019365 [Bulinus truncatus]
MALRLYLFCCLLNVINIVKCDTTTPPQSCQPQDATGILEINCRGYKKCDNFIVIEHTCDDTQVFDRDTMKCVDRASSTITCTDTNKCNGKADGMYADESDKCETYVRCLGGQIIAHLYCPKPLVFSNVIQSCDFVDNVNPPFVFYQEIMFITNVYERYLMFLKCM